MEQELDLVREVADAIARRIETEVLPTMLLRPVVRTATTPDCACHTYVALAQHAARIAREVAATWNR